MNADPPSIPRERVCGAHTDTPDGPRGCREPGIWSAVLACTKEPHAVVYLCAGHRQGGLIIVCDHGTASVAYAILAGTA